MSRHIDPVLLNDVDFTDALIYRLGVETRTQSALLTIGLDTRFHRQAATLFGIGEVDTGMVALVFSGVRSVMFRGLQGRRAELADDEPPHEYEIASLKVSRCRLHGCGYQIEIDCQNGQRCEMEFGDLRVERSSEPPGVIHDYEAEGGASAT